MNGDPAALLAEALAAHRQGRLDQAEACYRRILALMPRHFDALHLLGVIAYQRRDSQAAVQLIGQALQLDPRSAPAYVNLAAAQRALGEAEAALASYDRALALQPELPEALLNRSVLLAGLGQAAAAITGYDRLLALQPLLAGAHFARATALLALGQSAAALAGFDRALAIEPALAEALANRGAALRALGRLEAALDSLDRALALRTDLPEALNNRGSVLLDLHRAAEAVASYDRALALRPADAEFLNNRGIALSALGELEAAVAGYGEALRVRPDYPEALNNRGSALRELGRHEAAAEDYRRLLALAPDFPDTPGDLLSAQLNCCDWTEYEALQGRIVAGIAAGQRAILPFLCLSVLDDPGLQRRCAEIYAAEKFPLQPPLWRGERYGHDRIRLAYLSGNLHEHVIPYLMAWLFETHDRDRFEVTALSFGPARPSAMRTRLEHAFDRFVDVRSRSDGDVAQLIRDLEIDIAIDLNGYTGGSRAGILAFRPAPVQVSYVGFAGSMGTPAIDYILADRFLVPEGAEAFYSERVVRLPDSYWPTDPDCAIAERIPSRAECGLPEAGFVFCCFNSLHKIAPPVFAIWLRLLRQVPGSTLWLMGESATAIGKLRAHAAAQGIDPARLVFARRMATAEHLARHRLADLCLDTLPYNAHTTASDALWAGLPVLTCPGRSFAARVGGSLLTAAGLLELVAPSLAAYEAMALELAREPERLAAFKDRLARNHDRCRLFDSRRLRQSIERAYETMWARAERGAAPAGFDVAFP